MDGRAVELRQVSGGAGSACAATLASLPAWFAAPDANAAYRETAERSPTILAEADGTAIGLAILSRHSPEAAEVTLLAVRPEWHRQGVGRQLVELAERVLVEEGVEYLQVKTLSARHPYPGYASTRAFYGACGFAVLEELPLLWGPGSPAVQLVKALPRRPASRALGDLHHVELWVADLAPAATRWGWLLGELGYEPFQDWPAGKSWRCDGHYVVLEQSPALRGSEHDRCRPGLNHFAFHAGTRAVLDRLVAAAPAHGWRALFSDRYPYAGGPDHEAAYLEDEDGFEVELVANGGG